jgi:hypothetical protein
MCSRVFMVQQKIDTLYTVYLIYTQKYVASKVILKCSLIISVLFAVYFKQKKKIQNNRQSITAFVVWMHCSFNGVVSQERHCDYRYPRSQRPPHRSLLSIGANCTVHCRALAICPHDRGAD